jgi:hypothetical protein
MYYNDQTMSLTSYRRDLQACKRELADLLRQRQKIDERMARLQPLIGHLEGLCRELGDRAAKEHATKVELTTGLTELARVTLQEAYIPLSTRELKQRMEAKGFDFSHYSNPLSSIHVVLRRLVKSRQVKVVPQKAGRKAYQWLTAIDNLLSLLQTVGSVTERSQAQGVQVKPTVDQGAAASSRSVMPKTR